MKIQEQAYNLSIGSIPRSMWIILEDDLVDNCQAGNDVIVSGILIQRWKPLAKGKFVDIELVLLAHNVEVNNKLMPDIVSENSVNEFGQFWIENKYDPLKGRDFILSSICPQIFGLYIVKLAVALILAGGVEKKDENSRIRGDSHLLLVGDPGTGKSQFLKFASKVSMRSVLTSGIGTTNAGLTVSAVKEGGKWQLEAGALVLADGGICCIDEFSCIKEQDKTCIHEAMEQQTISVAKAGLVCRLSTRCSILAATNPKGKYDNHLSLSENTALASPLLSRFDIILVLLDTYDEKWDDMVASYILEGSNLLEKKKSSSAWQISKMRNYFSLIRYIKPKVTPACEKVLQTYYTRQRSLAERNYARTTPRLLQSLIRLAEGHARLMFRYEVLVVDAIVAIILVESSMSESSILSGLSALHTSFPDDPKLEYQKSAQTILELLKLENLLEESENYRDGLNLQKLLLDISSANSFQSTASVLSPHPASSANTQNGFQDAKQDCFTPQNRTHPNVADAESSENPVDILELIASFNEEAPICSDAEVLRHGLVGIGLGDEKNEMVIDEVSTLADLNGIFHENFMSSDATSESFRKILKKKKNPSQSTLNKLESKQCAENADFQQNPKTTEALAASSGKSPTKRKMLFQEVSEEMRNYTNNKTSVNSNLMINATNNNKPSTSSSKQIFQEETAQNNCKIIDETFSQNAERHKSLTTLFAESAKSEYFEPVDNVCPNFFKRKHSMTATNVQPSKHHQETLINNNPINAGAEAEGRDSKHQPEFECKSTTSVSKGNFNKSQSSLGKEMTPLNSSTPLESLPKDNFTSERQNKSVNDDFQSRIKSKFAKFAKPVISKDNSKNIDKICQPGCSAVAMVDPNIETNLKNIVRNNGSKPRVHTSSIEISPKQYSNNFKETAVKTIINTASKDLKLTDCTNRPIQTSQFSQATFKRVFSNAVDLSDYNNDDLDIEHLFDM